MAIGILNNIPSLVAENNLGITNQNLQKTLFRLSSGSRINSGADDAAGLAIADGLKANTTALTQSAQNANSGVGALQVADGALAQVTTLLNRAVTLATEASTGTVSQAQRGALERRIHSDQGRNRPHRKHHHFQRHLGFHRQHHFDLSVGRFFHQPDRRDCWHRRFGRDH